LRGTGIGVVTVSQGSAASSLSSRSFQTFGQYSQFLRAALADEESLQLSESLQGLAISIESLAARLRQSDEAAQQLAHRFQALLELLRVHRQLLQELGGHWQGFDEFSAHATALAHFQTQALQWQKDAASPSVQVPLLHDFELAAWRVLGAGALLLDVHEEAVRRAQEADADVSATRLYLRRLWGRFLTVLHLQP